MENKRLGTTAKVKIGNTYYTAQDIENFKKKPEYDRKISSKVNQKIHSAKDSPLLEASSKGRSLREQHVAFGKSANIPVQSTGSDTYTEHTKIKYQHRHAALNTDTKQTVDNRANRLETRVQNDINTSYLQSRESTNPSSSNAYVPGPTSKEKEKTGQEQNISQRQNIPNQIQPYSSNIIRSDGIRVMQGKNLAINKFNQQIHSVKKPPLYYPSGKISENVVIKSRQVFANQEDSGSQTIAQGMTIMMSGATMYDGFKKISPGVSKGLKRIAHGTYQLGSQTIEIAKKTDAFYKGVKYGTISLNKATFDRIKNNAIHNIKSGVVRNIMYPVHKIQGIYHTGQDAARTAIAYSNKIYHFARGITHGTIKVNVTKSVIEKIHASTQFNKRYVAHFSKNMLLNSGKMAKTVGRKGWHGFNKVDKVASRMIGGVGNSLAASDDSGSQALGIGLKGVHYANEMIRYSPKIYNQTKKMVKTTVVTPVKAGKKIALIRKKAIVMKQLIQRQGLKNAAYVVKQKAQAGIVKAGRSIIQAGINVIQKLASKLILPIALMLCVVLALNSILLAPVSGVSSLFSGTFTIRDTGVEYDIHEYLMNHLQSYQDAFTNQIMGIQDRALSNGYDYVRLIRRGSGPINGLDRNITRGDVSSLIFTMAGGNYVIMDTSDNNNGGNSGDNGNNNENNNQNIDTNRVDSILNEAGKLAGTRQVIFNIAGRYNIDPLLMIAICLHETGYGTSSAIMNYNNPSGQMSSSGLIHFETLEDGLEMTGRTLNNLINERGLHTIVDLGSVYCPVGAENDPYGLNGYWVPSVTRIYNELGGTGTISSGNAASMGNGVVSIIEPFFKTILLTKYELEPTQAQVDNLLQELWDNIFSIETGELPMEYCGGVHSCGERHANIASCPRISSGTHGSYTCPDCCYMICNGHEEEEIQPDGSIKIITTYCGGCIPQCNGYYYCMGHYIYGITVNMDGTQRLLAMYFMDPINRLANLSNPSPEEKEELANLKDNYELCLVYLQESQSNMRYGSGGQTDLSGVQFVNGTRRGNQQVIDLALAQEGQQGGQPYWSWCGFGGRVPWCACFVSWVLGNCGIMEPRYTYCPSGIEYFQANGRYAPGGYTDLVAGDVIFFDWEGDGESDHTGLVIGTDGTNVYTIEGNSGDACRVKSYDINSSVICGYGLMNY